MPIITESNPGPNGDTQTVGTVFTSLTIDFPAIGGILNPTVTCNVKLAGTIGEFTVSYVEDVTTVNRLVCSTTVTDYDFVQLVIRITDVSSGTNYDIRPADWVYYHYFFYSVEEYDPISGLLTCSGYQDESFVQSPARSITINHTAEGVLEYASGFYTGTINLIPSGSPLSQSFTPLNDPYDIDRITITYDEGYVASDKDKYTELCAYVDKKWTFNAYAYQDLSNLPKGGTFKIKGSIYKNISPWLCSDDGVEVGSWVVLLRTRDAQFFLTVCPRINYGKIPPLPCDDKYHRVYKYLTKGLKKDKGSILDPVSIGIIVSSTATTAVVKTQIGKLSIKNDYGSILPEGTEVVIYNPDKKNNFTKVLGPTGPL